MRTARPHPDSEEFGAFGRLVRKRREAASLSVEALAQEARVSPSLLVQIENGSRAASRATRQRICNVQALRLMPADLIPPLPARRPKTPRPLNCVLTPHDRVAQEASLLRSMRHAARRVLRPVWAYLGPASAHAFLRFRSRSPHAHAMATGLWELAAQIEPHLGPRPLEVLALGAGDGTPEVLLVEHLIGRGAVPRSMCLVDLSEPLLSRAYAWAVERLAQTEVWGLLADLEELSKHTDLLVAPDAQRLVLLLGGTLGELDDELRFLRHGLARCMPGDLLVLDVPLSLGDSEERVRKHEGLAARQAFDEAKDWLGASLAPHLPDLPLEWSLHLETRDVVLEHHSWCVKATVPSLRQPRAIEPYRFKRYSPARVTACLAPLGWERVAVCPYGNPAVGELHLYQRRTESDGLGRGHP